MVPRRYDPRNPVDHVDINYNAFYSPNKEFNDGGCAGVKGGITDFAKWQTTGLGQDQQSTLDDLTAMPGPAILAAAKKLLQMQ